MTTTEVSQVFGWEALDSRGRPTVGCAVELRGGSQGRAIVPSGASTGGHEAAELRDGGARYAGYGVTAAVRNVNTVIRDRLMGLDAADQEVIDDALESLDHDPALSSVGANAVLGTSLAALLAVADSTRTPLWRHLGGDGPLIPMPMVNIVSGGAHARGLLDIQDVLVIPVGALSFAEAIEWASRIRSATADLLDARGGSSALVADEGGLAGALGSNAAALALVTEGIHAAGLEPGVDASLALDLAANQLLDGDRYNLRVENLSLSASEWSATIADWCARFPIASLEDPLAEDDWGSWASASASHNSTRQLLGDDLFATNADRVTRGVETAVANAVLIKPNQAGNVTRTQNVLRLAQRNGYRTVVSARSGDTEDAWLADLAVGWKSGQIKVGSTMRSERTAKWNRVLEIEARAGSDARFAGWPGERF